MTLLKALVNISLVILLAPFLEGLLRKITARVQSRQGPPLLQPYFDLAKLLIKEDIEAGENPKVQRFAAALSFASILGVSLLVPFGAGAPLAAWTDVVLLVYLLTLCGVATLMAGLAAGSTYSLLGMSREMMAMITLEPLLAVGVVIGAVHAGSLRIDTVLAGSVYAAPIFPLSGLMMLGITILAYQAFVGRMPFDTAEAETEIMEGALVEYSGPKLALFKFTFMAKLVVYGAIVCGLYLPWGNALAWPLGLAVLLAKVILLTILVTLIAATHARYRIDQALQYYFKLFGAAVLALLLAVLGL